MIEKSHLGNAMTVRFGVVGASHWARTVHARTLSDLPGAHLVGVWSRTAAHATEIAQELNVTAFETFEEMLDAVDVVSIAVSPQAQASLALKAAAAGKSLLLEKPMAPDVVGANAVAQAIRDAGVSSIVFFMRRFVQEIEDVISAAAARKWTNARVAIHSNAMSSESPYASSIWRQQPHSELWDIGPHVLSVLLPVLGPATSVSAEFDDRHSLLTTTHAGGATSHISLSLRATADEIIREYRFSGDDGEIVLPEPSFSPHDAFARAALDLIEMHSTGTLTHNCDAAFGLEVSRLLAGGERSALNGGIAVKLDHGKALSP
ncbi:Gfo/Idh/MocA family oxidoreductase [Paraburkholderia dipogonis]|uniref:Gfo/Idh/MocA family oxidoreductase n=2 Tax=Paraburkholderia dipogonis TaxID=1211383 RepID=A0A4Y8MHG1_9BURK|nr:Gfo/Idh/MocA family oxidoreductase [Paraburkholderia dipogonis]